MEKSLNQKFLSPDKRKKKKSRIHKDMHYKLEHMYEDNGLTIVSEETSKQFTEYGFGQRESENKSASKNKMSNSKSNKFKHSNEMLGDSIENHFLENVLAKKNKNKNERMTRSSRVSPVYLATPCSEDGQKTHKTQLTPYKDSKNKENRKDKLNKLKRFNFFTSANDFDKLFTPKSTNKNFGKITENKDEGVKSINKKETIGKACFQFDTRELPKVPVGPNYKIDFLKNVNSGKLIQKKMSNVRNAFFRLSCGLFYEGGLSFGKLSGEGCLILKSIDVSSKETEEVKKSLLYQGGFSNDEVNGKGTLWFNDGSKFSGNFVSGQAHGNGKLVDKNAKIMIEGVWLNGQLY